MTEFPMTRRDLFRVLLVGGTAGVAVNQADKMSNSTPASVSPGNPHGSKIVFVMFGTAHGSNPGTMPEAVGSAIQAINERVDLDHPLDYPTLNGAPNMMLVNARGDLDMANFYDQENNPVSVGEFLSTITRTIVGSDKYTSMREHVGGLPPGTHLVIGHNMMPGPSGFGQAYGRQQPRATVRVNGSPYHAVLVGPIRLMVTRSPLKESWQLPLFARQAVGQVLGASYTDGGYDVESNGGTSTITAISPMATGHVYDRKGRRDTAVLRRDDPYIPTHLNWVKKDDEGDLVVDDEGRVVLKKGIHKDVPDFRGGPECANPAMSAVHDFAGDGSHESLADNHTVRYRDRTIAVIEAILNGTEVPSGSECGSATSPGTTGPTSTSSSDGSPDELPPEAELRIYPEPYRTSESIIFDATDSYDPDGKIERSQLHITGPTHNTGENVQQINRTVKMQDGKYTYTFTAAGTYDVRLTVEDDEGNTATQTEKIEIQPGTEAPNARVEVTPTDPVADEKVTFDASPSNHSEPIVGYGWAVYRVGNKNPLFEIDGQQFTHKFSAGKYAIKLVVTDDEGDKDTVRVSLDVREPSDAPTARFEIQPEQPEVGHKTVFDASNALDPDGTIQRYTWRFYKDGSQNPYQRATGERITERFADTGSYTVELVVTDDDGVSDRTIKTFSVDGNDSPTVKITASSETALVGDEIRFSADTRDDDGQVEVLRWNFDDASDPVTEVSSVTHRFDSPGTYTVNLTVKDDDGATGSDSVTVTINENESPVAQLSASANSIEVGESITFDGSGSSDSDDDALSYTWKFYEKGAESPYARDSGKKTTETYSESGEYTVELVVADEHGKSDSAFASVSVDSNDPPMARIKPSSVSIQPGESVTLDGSDSTDPETDALSYTWKFYEKGAETPYAEDSGSQTKETYSESGEYTVELVVADEHGKSDSASASVNVENDTPTARIDSESSLIEAGESVTFDGSESADPNGDALSYTWKFYEKGAETPYAEDSGEATTETYSASGEYAVKLIVADEHGATDSESVSISVDGNDSPTAHIDPESTSIESGESITFDGSGSTDPEKDALSYTWKFYEKGAETPYAEDSGEATTETYSASGEYAVKLIVADEHGATDSESVSISVDNPNRQPTARVEPSSVTIEPGESVTFDGSASADPDGDALTYTWKFYEEGSQNPYAKDSEKTTTETFNSDPRDYAVELVVTDEHGKSDSASASIHVDDNDPPTASFSISPSTATAGESITFDASTSTDDRGINSYNWEFYEIPKSKVIERKSGKVVSMSFGSGSYSVQLTVTDTNGEKDSSNKDFEVE